MRLWDSLSAANSLVDSRGYFINAGVGSPRSTSAFAQACLALTVSISRRRCWREARDTTYTQMQFGTHLLNAANNSHGPPYLNRPWSNRDLMSSEQILPCRL